MFKISRITIVATALFLCVSCLKAASNEPNQPNQGKTEGLRNREESLTKMKKLGLMVALYAVDHKGKDPNFLEEIKLYANNEIWDWVIKNARYVGKSKTASIDPQAVIAYDKTMLLEMGQTNVLFNDGHVEFCDKARVKEIKLNGVSIADLEKRMDSAYRLSDLGKALMVYANSHKDEYPQKLDELASLNVNWINSESIKWYEENVKYSGYRIKISDRPDAVLAYDKTLLNQQGSEGTNVLYNNGRVELIKTADLEKLGIKDLNGGK